jgi:anti-anti-sigma factor
MDIVIEQSTDSDGRAVLAVAGAIDLQTRERLLEAGRKALSQGPSALVLDLDDVSFIDSTGIGALVELGHDAADASDGADDDESERGGLVIRNPSARVLRILEISGLADAWAMELPE